MKTGYIKSVEFANSIRLNPTYHLFDGLVYEKVIKSREFDFLGNIASDIFTSGRVKRIYTQNDFGIPYLGNNEVRCFNPLLGCKYISRKFFDDADSYLKAGMILTGRVGQDTVGTYTYCNTDYEKTIGSDNIIRISIKEEFLRGYIFSFLASKVGYALTRRHIAGGAQPFVTEQMLSEIPVPFMSGDKQEIIHNLILNAANLRTEANQLLKAAEDLFYKSTGLDKLTDEYYEHFGPRSSSKRKLHYTVRCKDLSSLSINAFNYSEKIRNLITYIKSKIKCETLYDVLDERKFFSTGSFPRLEIDSPKAIKLINQSDIFNTTIIGKKIARRGVKVGNLVSYGELLIAAVGTLGESESFCRTVFANEELKGQLISGEFIRMNCRKEILPGYLYIWLNSDYGFRLIRATQTGTKQCRPIHSLLYKIPVPLVDFEIRQSINDIVCEAHTKKYEASVLEDQAKLTIENELDSWQ